MYSVQSYLSPQDECHDERACVICKVLLKVLTELCLDFKISENMFYDYTQAKSVHLHR